MKFPLTPGHDEQRIGKLDSIRGIAALVVLTGHCGPPAGVDASGLVFWLPIFWDGESAVVMFFLLSGYVLALQLRSPKRPTYAGFLIRRFMRIWPPFAVTIVLTYLILSALGLPAEPDTIHRGVSRMATVGDLLQNLLFMGNPYAINSPVWSLFVEMRLSIAFPLLFLIAYRLDFFTALVVSTALSWVGSR